MKKMLIMAALAFGLSAIPTTAAVLYPSIFSPLRSAIVNQINVLTDNPSLTPQETRQLRLLRQARRNLDRPGRATLYGDVQILASLATSIGRTFPTEEFNPLLQQAVLDYSDLLLQQASDLQTTIETLPPSGNTTLASSTVDDAVLGLNQLDPDASTAIGIQTLTRAVSRLRSAESAINRARPVVTRVSRMTAIVDGQRFAANAAGVSAVYSPGTQTLTVVGRETGGLQPGSRSIQIILSSVTPGTTSYSLGRPGVGSYATYTASSPTNSIGATSISGNVFLTLDATSGLVTGRFSFEAGDPFTSQDRVRVNSGDFSVLLRSLGGP